MISTKVQFFLTELDIEKIDKKELRKYISMVLQDVFLFSGTYKIKYQSE